MMRAFMRFALVVLRNVDAAMGRSLDVIRALLLGPPNPAPAPPSCFR